MALGDQLAVPGAAVLLVEGDERTAHRHPRGPSGLRQEHQRQESGDLVREAIAAVGLSPGSRGLDAGCGPGGHLPLLAEAVGPSGRVVGADLSRPHVEQARREVERAGLSARVEVIEADLRQPLPFADGELDWVWCADVIWPPPFDPPWETVAELARVVRPGGTVTLFFVLPTRGLLLPAHARIEFEISAAHSIRFGPPAPPEASPEAAGAWLLRAGLVGLEISLHFASETQPLGKAARDWLEEHVRELRTVERTDVPALDDAAWKRWREISDQSSAAYLLDRPDYLVTALAVRSTATVPDWQAAKAAA